MRITYTVGARTIGGLDIRLSGVVFKRVGVWADRSGVCISSTPLFCWVVTLGKLFTHIVFPVLSALRNWDTKESNLASIRTGLI